MPLDAVRRTSKDARAFAVPVAVAGSIALMLSATPAQATPVETERPRGLSLRAIPAAVLHAPASAAVAPESYTVVSGDTVSAIAARFGLRTADVLALNGLTWQSVIYPGQALRLVGSTAPAPSAPPPAAPAASTSYTIQRGDTISAIAQRHGLSTPTVLAANGLSWSSIIYPGQTLAIPGAAATPAAPVAAAPVEPAPATPPPPASATYTVRGGDTVSGIAQRHGISVQAVFAANGLGWSSIIYPGQTLAIPGAAASAPAPPAAAASVAGLDAEQTANARLIIQVGRELGISDRGIAIALGTAMQESWIRNLNWGDRDSLGLFQQRPSTGWGTAEEILDPVRATKVFFGGASDPNGSRTRGLLDIAGWEGLSFAQAAQAVQISGFPDRYVQWEQPAYAWLAALG